MNANEFAERLLQAKNSADFQSAVESVLQDIPNESADIEFVRTVLRFMEQNPLLDYGLPGPLVHFVERFYLRGYETELIASLSRRPTPHTIWMLNRVINGTNQPDERDRLIKVLRGSRNHNLTDAQTKKLIEQFLQHIEK